MAYCGIPSHNTLLAGFMMSELFRVSAKAVIIEDGRVLLIQKPSGNWDLPGGRLESGESPYDAVGRESREELGLPIAIDKIVHCGIREKEEKPDVFAVSFLCNLIGDTKDIVLSDEHEKARWFKRAKVRSIMFDSAYLEAIECAFDELDFVERTKQRNHKKRRKSA